MGPVLPSPTLFTDSCVTEPMNIAVFITVYRGQPYPGAVEKCTLPLYRARPYRLSHLVIGVKMTVG